MPEAKPSTSQVRVPPVSELPDRIPFRQPVIYASGSGSPKQAVKNLRVDHCKFQGNYIVIETTGGATGVFDHNEFLNSYAARLYGSNDPNPRPPYPLGTSDALFFEDNIITANSSGNPPHWIASNSHSKYVVRHNQFNYSKSLWDIVDAHGACEVKGRGSATGRSITTSSISVPQSPGSSTSEADRV